MFRAEACVGIRVDKLDRLSTMTQSQAQSPILLKGNFKESQHCD